MTIAAWAQGYAAERGYRFITGGTGDPGIVTIDPRAKTVTVAAGAETWTLEMNAGGNWNNHAQRR